MSLLSISALDIRHGLLQAVREVTFQVGQGETVALIGANGAGKTTLLRAIAGAHRPSRGQIHLDGLDVTQMPAYQRVSMGIALVPEGRRLFAAMTVEENLRLARASGRQGDWTVDRVMDTFPMLKARRKARCGTLSGGEQQATAIGRALMTNPRVLLLDEPSAGLAPKVVLSVFQTLSKLQEQGMSVLLAEQSLTFGLSVASRAYIISEGHIVLSGTPAELSSERSVVQAYLGA